MQNRTRRGQRLATIYVANALLCLETNTTGTCGSAAMLIPCPPQTPSSRGRVGQWSTVTATACKTKDYLPPQPGDLQPGSGSSTMPSRQREREPPRFCRQG